jgi:hypothetical protein
VFVEELLEEVPGADVVVVELPEEVVELLYALFVFTDVLQTPFAANV